MFMKNFFGMPTALCLLIAGPEQLLAASCKTSSGSECSVSCSVGTASAVCAENSKSCSTSCSDSSGNLELNLARSVGIVTGGRVDEYSLREFFRYEFDVDRFIYNDGGDYIDGYQFGTDGAIIIDIDPPR